MRADGGEAREGRGGRRLRVLPKLLARCAVADRAWPPADEVGGLLGRRARSKLAVGL